MKLSVNINSYRRPTKVRTLDILPAASVWVHACEAEAYKGGNLGADIRILPDSLRGNLPRVKNFILDAAFAKGAEACLMLDDDISKVGYFERCVQNELRENDLLAFVEQYSELCRAWGFFLWGVNVNGDKQCYREYTPFSTTSYVSSSFAVFLKGNECRYDERFPLKEDYDMTIQQCHRYRGLLRVNKAHYIKLGAENTGGCAAYRNLDREREQVLLLQKKWGSQIVKLDSLDASRNHRSKKIRTFDINPTIHIPILGV